MARFSDNWLLDKVMFDYIQGGSCACCGFPHLFAPGGLEGLIHAMSDLETDSKINEVNAAMVSPWPDDMRDQIWGDRLLLRYRLKRGMRDYRQFLEEVVNDNQNNNEDDGEEDDANANTTNNNNEKETNLHNAIPLLHNFCTNHLSPHELQQLFTLHRSELTSILKTQYKIDSAYAIVFCAVVEQLANFEFTEYTVDAPPSNNTTTNNDDAEELFEGVLKYNGRGPGFHVNVVENVIVEDCEEEWKVNEEILRIFLERVVSLAGPTLLARAVKVVDDDNGDDSSDGSDGDEKKSGESEVTSSDNSTPSFRSDRRVARLMIARCWADRLIEKYRSMHGDVDG